MNTTDESVAARWFPVSRSEEVVARHVVHTQIFGQELAVWRDDAGAVNGWENRCPHRGVRLSIARNDGTALQCQYHGWRFATQSGQCVAIPAHPMQKPAATIRATTYPILERGGYVWASLSSPTSFPITMPEVATTLRSIVIQATYHRVGQALLRGYRFSVDPTLAGAALQEAAVAALDPFVFRTSSVGERNASLMFLLQPHTENQTVVHAIFFDAVPGAKATSSGSPEAAALRLATLRHHNERMRSMRDALEQMP